MTSLLPSSAQPGFSQAGTKGISRHLVELMLLDYRRHLRMYILKISLWNLVNVQSLILHQSTDDLQPLDVGADLQEHAVVELVSNTFGFALIIFRSHAHFTFRSKV